MAANATMRLNKVLRELNISLDRAVEHLASKGYDVEARPTTKISNEVYNVLLDEFQTDRNKKVASKEVSEEKRKEKEALRQEIEKEQVQKRVVREDQQVIRAKATLSGPKTIGKIDLDKKEPVKEEAPKPVEEPVKETQKETPQEKVVVAKPEEKEEPVVKAETKPVVEEKQVEVKKEKPKVEVKKPIETKPPVKKEKPKEQVAETTATTVQSGKIETKYQKLSGPKMTGEKIDLTQFKKPKKKKEDTTNKDAKAKEASDRKRKRRRISKEGSPKPGGGGQGSGRFGDRNRRGGQKRNVTPKVEPTEEEVQKQVRETLEKLQGKTSKSKGAKYRKEKRDSHRQKSEEEIAMQEMESKTLKVTEFVTVAEVATMMELPTTKIISACMSLGIMVTMNQRLDAETLSIVADEFGYEVEFITADIEEAIQVEEDRPEDLEVRAPIVTVMGHVDHGKTSLLDYIRKENVIAGESGGITQHIGAYGVTLDNDEKIAFLDTPGHEAFTAMRARGAQVTDVAIIVIAADDDVMPQTKEAISHAQAAGVPIVFAINKVDKPNANPDKVKESLANMNLLVEDWGGKIQSQDISAKTGQGVNELLEKVLL